MYIVISMEMGIVSDPLECLHQVDGKYHVLEVVLIWASEGTTFGPVPETAVGLDRACEGLQ